MAVMDWFIDHARWFLYGIWLVMFIGSIVAQETGHKSLGGALILGANCWFFGYALGRVIEKMEG